MRSSSAQACRLGKPAAARGFTAVRDVSRPPPPARRRFAVASGLGGARCSFKGEGETGGIRHGPEIVSSMPIGSQRGSCIATGE